MKKSLHCSSAVAQWKRPRLSVTQAASPSPLQGMRRHFRSRKKGGTGERREQETRQCAQGEGQVKVGLNPRRRLWGSGPMITILTEKESGEKFRTLWSSSTLGQENRLSASNSKGGTQAPGRRPNDPNLGLPGASSYPVSQASAAR